MKPNLIERLEEIPAMIDDLRTIAGDIVTEPVEYGKIDTEISNIEGVIVEILTMVDGR